jgi:hypothetical protein
MAVKKDEPALLAQGHREPGRIIFVPVPRHRAIKAGLFLWTASEDLMDVDPRLAKTLERVADAIEDAVTVVPDKKELTKQFKQYLKEQNG